MKINFDTLGFSSSPLVLSVQVVQEVQAFQASPVLRDQKHLQCLIKPTPPIKESCGFKGTAYHTIQ